MTRDSKELLDRADGIFRARIQRDWDQYRTERGYTGKPVTPPNAWFKKDSWEWEEALEEARGGR